MPANKRPPACNTHQRAISSSDVTHRILGRSFSGTQKAWDVLVETNPPPNLAKRSLIQPVSKPGLPQRCQKRGSIAEIGKLFILRALVDKCCRSLSLRPPNSSVEVPGMLPYANNLLSPPYRSNIPTTSVISGRGFSILSVPTRRAGAIHGRHRCGPQNRTAKDLRAQSANRADRLLMLSSPPCASMRFQ